MAGRGQGRGGGAGAVGERARLLHGVVRGVGTGAGEGRRGVDGVERSGVGERRVGGGEEEEMVVRWVAGMRASEAASGVVGSGVAGVTMRMVWRGVECGGGRGCSMSTTKLSLRRPSASYETNTRSAKVRRV